MKKYLIHLLKIIKSFFLRPKKTIFWIISDYKKDLFSKNYKSNYKKVWCAGLPKSGTTLIEKIFDNLPYVRQNASFNRVFPNTDLDHPHGISHQIFKQMPDNKYTFLKTHTHYSKKYENIYLNYDLRIIVSMRDLRDMLISRYYHILSDKNHWLFYKIINLNKTDGFILSMKEISKEDKISSLEYFYNWVKNWLVIAKKKNYLILWYENYKNDPINYIKKILNYVEFNNFGANKIYENINMRNKESTLLEKNLLKYGREKSTFRKGEIDSWKFFFNDEINDFFYKNIPDSFDKINFKD